MELGFNPSTLLVTCDLGKQSDIYHGNKGERVKITLIKSPVKMEKFDKNSQILIYYFSPKHSLAIEREISLQKDSLVSASTLRFVDLSLDPLSEVYEDILKGLVLNPIIIKGAVDNIYFKREDVVFGWGIGEGRAKFGNFEPTDCCIIGTLGELAFISLYNRYLLGYINNVDINYIREEKDKIIRKSSKVYKELGEAIKENEDHVVFADDIGFNSDMKKKLVGINKLPIRDRKILLIASNIMKNPLASPFLGLVLGDKVGIERICDKATSLGLNIYKVKVSTPPKYTF
ncbi:hypothetical protein DJ523_05745 [Sulfolobus sp. E5]|nr:hypothetical protein DJ523_05745 [Sulfolobus sp. E5]TRM87049.1 hypothetical protein DJ529_09690 [Sulfolobus sp. C3]TRM89070.1 hypothetical protein DJ526_08470 [Sulfolobus sp. A20-N-G8]TRN04698.1 hypothetical protein DJ527_00260 [Sulfolobus sp. F1]